MYHSRCKKKKDFIINIKTKILLVLLFVGINISTYYISKMNSDSIIDIQLKNNLKMLTAHYKVLLETQTKIAKSAYKSTITMDRVIEILVFAKNASVDEKLVLRKELHDILKMKYEILKEEGILQYQFVLPNNESFYRAHKPSKFGDNLTNIREDFKYTNEKKKSIKAFVQGRTTHAFRNIFPLFDKNNNHIGAMEISFPSDSFQWYLNNISGIHSHFIVDKKIFDTKIWQRDDLALTYSQSAEHKNYMLALGDIHTKEECVIENTKKLESVREQIDSNIVLEKAFGLYVKHMQHYNHIEVVSFLPVYGMSEKPLAWIVSYDENSIVASTLLNVLIVRSVLFFLSLVLVYFIFKQLSDKQKLKDITKEQENLLSLFDIGESTLFKWNNDEHWSIAYASKSVQSLLNYERTSFMNKDITYLECIHKDDLARVEKEVKIGSSSLADYFTHKPYRVITKDNQVKWVIDNTAIQRDSDGNITHFIGYINDITEIKNQQQLLDDILNSSDDAIFLTDFKDVLLSNYKFKELVPESFYKNIINLFMNIDGYLHKELLKEN